MVINMLNREEIRMKHSLWSNQKRALADMKIMGYMNYVYLLLDIVTQIFVPFLLVLIPSKVIGLLQNRVDLSKMLLEITLWIGLIFIFNLVRTYTHHKFDKMSVMISDIQYWRRLEKKLLTCDILQFEDGKRREQLWEVIACLNQGDGMNHHSGIRGLYLYSSALVINVGGFILYAVFAGRLHPLLLMLLILTAVINCYAKIRAIRYEFDHIDSFWENGSRFWYLKKESINTEKAKDIRMYHMYPWFKKALDQNTKEATNVYDDVQKHHYYGNIAMCVSSLFRDGVAYGFLIYQLLQGKLEIAEFILYLGIVDGFGTWISQIVESYTFLRKINDRISMFWDYVGEEKKDVDQEDLAVPVSCHSITFEDISFGYGDHLIFDHFSLHLSAGEKVALVGMNGAGKTTLMKLLCGLYPLNGGRILIGGKDIATMRKEEHHRYLSILFQDVHVLPFSIAKNVSCTWTTQEQKQMGKVTNHNRYSRAFASVDASDIHLNQYDEERVKKSLQQAKLLSKVQVLPNGINTALTKILDPAGIMLSGGETQRLMLARALYKDAPILVLDEPTAALDPIAESELYEEYAHLCQDKISIFISHRLSSTRFCDRILFLEQGKIVEVGNHAALIKLGGKYADMYRIQSHYYQKEVEKNEAGI